MPHSVLDEDRISLDEAAQLMPGRGNEHPTRQSVRRWVVIGSLVNGVRVKLEARRVGDTWWTSKQAVARWLDALNPAEPTAEARTPAATTKAGQRAGRELTRRGL